MLQNVRMFTEYQSYSPVIPALVKISTFYAKQQGYWGAMQNAKHQVEPVIEQLLARPVGERVAVLYYLLSYEMYPNKGADPLAIFERGQVPTARSIAMLKPLCLELKKRKIPLDLMYTDNEGGFGFFEIGQEGIRRILRSARARRHMPPEVAGLDPDHLTLFHPNFKTAKAIWDGYAMKLKFDALRKVIVGSKLFNIRPGRGMPIQRPSAVNFHSINASFPIYDYNGWRMQYTSIDTWGSSCPSVYVGGGGGRYVDKVHHPIWNNLIDSLNWVRSCLGSNHSRVHPIVPEPSYCHPWVWEVMIAHMVRSGISWTGARNAFIYWNANSPQTQDPLAAEIIARHDLNVPAQTNLPEIPLDTDIIQTGGYTTTYEQFIEAMPSAVAAWTGGGGG